MYSVYVYRENHLEKRSSLLGALGVEPDQAFVLSLTGGGGKTTTIRRIAQELAQLHRKVIVTTTTHMKEESLPWFCTEPEWRVCASILERYGQLWAGVPHPGGKIAGLPEPLMERLLSLSLPVLIESDGARRLPVKCPADHEPVIRKETSQVINVYGLDAVGSPLSEVCFRSELAAHLLGRNAQQMQDVVTAEDIARLAVAKEAGRKGSTNPMSHTVLLNKADVPGGYHKALAVCRKIAELTERSKDACTKTEQTEFRILVTAENDISQTDSVSAETHWHLDQ